MELTTIARVLGRLKPEYDVRVQRLMGTHPRPLRVHATQQKTKMRCEKAHTDVDRASGSQGLVQGEDLARVRLELKNPVSVLRGRRRCAEARSTSTGASFVQRWDRQSLSGRREPSVQSRPCVIQQKRQ